ncbi:hypothetical protein QCA50_016614 [Cerrena zonata]|uniref:Uncharacterized protein n=1 Tax=Cerrena zonata TaxID=2478898 RepID=A0AAW0FMZ2_9APHY
MTDANQAAKTIDVPPAGNDHGGGADRGRGRTSHEGGSHHGGDRGRGRGRARWRGRGRGKTQPTGKSTTQEVHAASNGTQPSTQVANEIQNTDGKGGNHDQPKSSSFTLASVSLHKRGGGGDEGDEYEKVDVISRLPPLIPASGPPIEFEGSLGGIGMPDPPDDLRLRAVYLGFPVSVHPLRVPNARAHFTPTTSYSIIDFRFLRLSGLLHQMTPLRDGMDKVELTSPGGEIADVFGWVDIIFDAQGYEFNQRCWVLPMEAPIEIQLGLDWAAAYKVGIDWKRGGPTGIGIEWADAKRVRDLQDTYTII